KPVFEALKITIAPALINIVDAKYVRVLEKNGTSVSRGKGRVSIIAACLFYAYQEMGEYRTSTYIHELFKINQSNMTVGMSKYHAAFPEDRNKTITPEKLLPWIMNLVGLNMQKHYKKILAI